MPDWLTTLGGITDVVGKIFGTGYNMYTNQRDFDYQRNLQQQIFEREDTAVQRRMADLQAAGLNPNLAAGSAAQAGSVVSRSNTNDLNIGSMLDTIMAQKQIKNQELQTESIKRQNSILEDEKMIKYLQKKSDYFDLLYNLGFDPKVTAQADGTILVQPNINSHLAHDSPRAKKIDEDLKYVENTNKYLDKELKFQTADHVADYIKSGTGLIRLFK